MHNLLVDIGNTRSKIALFQANELQEFWIKPIEDLFGFLQELISTKDIYAALLSDVSGKWQKEWVLNLPTSKVFWLNQNLPMPFKNKYATPQTLGADRMALVAGAIHFYPNQACLVIDAGTCVTYEVMNSFQEYLGGNITPGLHMRLKAMHTFTGKLPLPNWELPLQVLGTDTQSCLLNGAYYGLLGEINHFVEEYRQQFPEIKVLLTGGDSEILAKKIKTSIFVNEHLLLYGLNKILTDHAK
ncbi:MAG: type III pantothenate kinase [Bacteroidia bacterium]|nr:type III pantothenate kinase [Bacteroidia bacterium]MCF8426950.1 type III pantothenate kinase [Bacteroidia bacterium]MCF8447781.1 type III pantothenate kinase [Bacteroidia bacterium]